MSSAHRPWIEIFSNPTYPDRYLCDLASAQAQRHTGVRVAPVTTVGGEVFHRTLMQQKPHIVVTLRLAQAD